MFNDRNMGIPQGTTIDGSVTKYGINQQDILNALNARRGDLGGSGRIASLIQSLFGNDQEGLDDPNNIGLNASLQSRNSVPVPFHHANIAPYMRRV